MGLGVQVLIDEGFGGGSSDSLKGAIALFFAIAAAMAFGTFIRFYLVSWLGERVSADIRKQVFDNIVRLHPGFFETNRSLEIMSRITTDTTLLQTIIGSSFSMALRSGLTTTGALVMMFITNLKLSMIIALGVPLWCCCPILVFRAASQETIQPEPGQHRECRQLRRGGSYKISAWYRVIPVKNLSLTLSTVKWNAPLA